MIRAAIAFAALLVAVWFGVSRHYAIEEDGLRLDEAARRDLFRRLRESVDRAPCTTTPAPAPDPPATAARAGLARLFCAGRPVAEIPLQHDLSGRGFLDHPAVAALDPAARRACRIIIDLDRGRAPIITAPDLLFAFSLVPGVDGIGLEFGDRELRLYPDELLRDGLLAGFRPLPDLDLDVGLDVRAVLRRFALRAGASPDTWRRTPRRFFRFRTETWAEPADAGPPLPLFRWVPPAPPLDAAHLRDAARAAAAYLARHLDPRGRFDYEYDTISDRVIPSESGTYSLPRHAGAAYFLAQAAGALHDDALRAAAARALDWLREQHPPGCDREGAAYIGLPDDEKVDLGSAGLALLAAVEYQRSVADPRFLPWARRLAAFIVAMQKDDGDFCHLYDAPAGRRDEHTRLLYYSGEATFALARFALLDDPAPPAGLDRASLVPRIDRALDHLTGAAYGYFAGQFFYGEDHWTCLALDAAWDLLPDAARRDRYADFCEGFARFLARTEFHEGEGPTRDQPDLVGAYGFTPLLTPHSTPVGSRSEALISIHRMARRRGHDDVARTIAASVRRGMRFLLGRQLRKDGDLLAADPAAGAGGFLMSDALRFIRIDFEQHAGSAMLRAADEPAFTAP